MTGFGPTTYLLGPAGYEPITGGLRQAMADRRLEEPANVFRTGKLQQVPARTEHAGVQDLVVVRLGSQNPNLDFPPLALAAGHPVFVLRGGALTKVRADRIRDTDLLPVVGEVTHQTVPDFCPTPENNFETWLDLTWDVVRSVNPTAPATALTVHVAGGAGVVANGVVIPGT